MRGTPSFGLTVLFVADKKKLDVWVGAKQCFAPTGRCHHIFHPNQIRGNDSFHIRGTATPEIITFDAWIELRVVRFGFDDIEMTCEEDFTRAVRFDYAYGSAQRGGKLRIYCRVFAIKIFDIKASVS